MGGIVVIIVIQLQVLHSRIGSTARIFNDMRMQNRHQPHRKDNQINSSARKAIKHSLVVVGCNGGVASDFGRIGLGHRGEARARRGGLCNLGHTVVHVVDREHNLWG